MSDEHERGLAFFGEVLGTDESAGLREHMASDDFGKECATW